MWKMVTIFCSLPDLYALKNNQESVFAEHPGVTVKLKFSQFTNRVDLSGHKVVIASMCLGLGHFQSLWDGIQHLCTEGM